MNVRMIDGQRDFIPTIILVCVRFGEGSGKLLSYET